MDFLRRYLKLHVGLNKYLLRRPQAKVQAQSIVFFSHPGPDLACPVLYMRNPVVSIVSIYIPAFAGMTDDVLLMNFLLKNF